MPERLGGILRAEACHTAADAKVRVCTADDGGLTALRGRAAFSVAAAITRTRGLGDRHSVLGPVMTGYAEWVQQRTEEFGITRALCVMREGRCSRS